MFKLAMLNELNDLPNGFLTARTEELLALLKKPTLIHLPGENTQPLFVCTLLHGNEDTGLAAIQHVLQKYRDKKLPRAISLFIGNVEAAAANQRHLDNQPDYNRVWPGTEHPECDESRLMQQVVDIMKQRHPFASIDLHNNTGRNPHYACINRLNAEYLQLARLFGHTVVYFINPKGVQSAAFAEICPSVTLECGKVGEVDGIEHAGRFIETVMQLEHLPDNSPTDIDLFHTVARVTIPEDVSFSFENHSDLILNPNIELYNFREVESGTPFAKIKANNAIKLEAWDDTLQNKSDDYFKIKDQSIVLKKPLMPSMFTRNTEVIRQDCLCYLMERIDYHRK